LNLEFFGVLVIVFLLKDSLYLEEEYYLFLKSSEINFWILILVILLFVIILMIESGIKISLNIIFIVLYIIIGLRDLISFFLFYEMIFVLIIFSIILLGYSYERLIAGFLIIFYSFLFSSPVLIILILFDCRFLMKE